VAFRKPVAVSAYAGALSPSHQVLLAWTAPDDAKTGHPECGLSALDAATGETLWEKVVPFSGPEVAPRMGCSPERILVSPRGAILIADRWLEGSHRLALGFDPATGTVRFQRALDLYDIPAGTLPDGPLEPSMPLYLEQQKYASWTSGTIIGETPARVALVPATGRETIVAIFRADLAENLQIQGDSRLWVSGYAWARGAVVATGSLPRVRRDAVPGADPDRAFAASPRLCPVTGAQVGVGSFDARKATQECDHV
jgi:hypothetical protein